MGLQWMVGHLAVRLPSRRNGAGCVESPVVGRWLLLYPTAHGFSGTCQCSLGTDLLLLAEFLSREESGDLECITRSFLVKGWG